MFPFLARTGSLVAATIGMMMVISPFYGAANVVSHCDRLPRSASAALSDQEHEREQSCVTPALADAWATRWRRRVSPCHGPSRVSGGRGAGLASPREVNVMSRSNPEFAAVDATVEHRGSQFHIT